MQFNSSFKFYNNYTRSYILTKSSHKLNSISNMSYLLLKCFKGYDIHPSRMFEISREDDIVAWVG